MAASRAFSSSAVGWAGAGLGLRVLRVRFCGAVVVSASVGSALGSLGSALGSLGSALGSADLALGCAFFLAGLAASFGSVAASFSAGAGWDVGLAGSAVGLAGSAVGLAGSATGAVAVVVAAAAGWLGLRRAPLPRWALRDFLAAGAASSELLAAWVGSAAPCPR